MNNKDTENKLTKSQQALVDVIHEKLNDGHIPWDDGLHHYGRVHNASTGAAYRGQNALLLTILSQAKFNGEPRYMTFNQAKEKGYHVKKGAKGVPIDIYKIIDKRTNKEVDVVAVKKEMEAMTDEEARTFQKENLYALPKSYTVFNAKDIAGIPPLEITPTDERLRNERIERLIANSPAPITYDGNGNNYYSPSHDEIHLTDRKQYKAIEYFYDTALHEMSHATGHSSRLNRPHGAFGSEAYAREELVAELSSVFTCFEYELDHTTTLDNNVEYIRLWAEQIKNDPQELLQAIKEANKASKYLIEIEKNAQKTEEQSKLSAPDYELMRAIAQYGGFESGRINIEDFSKITNRTPDELVAFCEKYGGHVGEFNYQGETVNVLFVDKLKNHYDAERERRTKANEPYTTTTLDTNVKEWYKSAFPLDDESENIEADLTFYDVAKSLDDGNYKSVADGDTFIRERIFNELKDVLRVQYEDIYDKWLERGKSNSKPLLPEEPQPSEQTQKKGEHVATSRKEQTVNLRITEEERELLNEFVDSWKESNSERMEIIDFGVNRPTSPDFWIGLEILGEVERSDAKFSVKFDRTHVHNVSIKTIDEKEYIEAQKPQPTEQIPQNENGQKDKTVPLVPVPHEFITNTQAIPEEMKKLNNWVAFRTEKIDGKVKKILLSPTKDASSVQYLKWAKSDDSTTWTSFNNAVAFAKKYQLDGVAFALTNSNYTCIDLDHHLDENGEPSDLAQKFINSASNTYIEKSVSGRGLHIFYVGQKPQNLQNRNINLDLEVYDNKRFISITGNIYGDTKEIAPPSNELNTLLQNNLSHIRQYATPSTPLGMDDTALIEKIRNSKKGQDFNALMRGENLYNDHSVSDFRLCNILAFFSGGDAIQVERVFRSSGLYRPEKGDNYVHRTAEKACSTLSTKYTPSRRSQNNSSRRTEKTSTNNGR